MALNVTLEHLRMLVTNTHQMVLGVHELDEDLASENEISDRLFSMHFSSHYSCM